MPIRPPTHKPVTRGKRHVAKETARATTAQRGYGYKWQQVAKGYLKAHPLCVHCEEQGRVTLATDVDHIIPHKGNMELFWDIQGNCQSLCSLHHKIKSGKGL